MSNAWILAPTVVIDAHFYFNLAAILELRDWSRRV
jgi:hypothetical protein